MLTSEEILKRGKKVIAIEGKTVLSLQERINDQFVKAIKLISNCTGRVIISGIGKSGIIARKIVSTMNSTGTPALFLHPSDAVHGDVGIIRKDDVFICISNSGSTAEMVRLIPIIKRIGVTIIAMVGNTSSYLAEQADVFLDISVEEEACPLNLAPTSSSTATLVIGDALAVTLLEEKNFTKEDFAFYHPAGSLGKRLIMKIEDIMTRGDDVPIVYTGTPLKDTILTMTRKRLGATCVIDQTGKLSGIVTDGDLRRALQNSENLTNLTAKDIMTSEPKVIKSNILAASALTMMEQYNITQLIVIDEQSIPIGMVHIHELVKSGISSKQLNS
jgi:arabinose-5-phosphate isomerase